MALLLARMYTSGPRLLLLLFDNIAFGKVLSRHTENLWIKKLLAYEASGLRISLVHSWTSLWNEKGEASYCGTWITCLDVQKRICVQNRLFYSILLLPTNQLPFTSADVLTGYTNCRIKQLCTFWWISLKSVSNRIITNKICNEQKKKNG